jgi:hypothetical protein
MRILARDGRPAAARERAQSGAVLGTDGAYAPAPARDGGCASSRNRAETIHSLARCLRFALQTFISETNVSKNSPCVPALAVCARHQQPLASTQTPVTCPAQSEDQGAGIDSHPDVAYSNDVLNPLITLGTHHRISTKASLGCAHHKSTTPRMRTESEMISLVLEDRDNKIPQSPETTFPIDRHSPFPCVSHLACPSTQGGGRPSPPAEAYSLHPSLSLPAGDSIPRRYQRRGLRDMI